MDDLIEIFWARRRNQALTSCFQLFPYCIGITQNNCQILWHAHKDLWIGARSSSLFVNEPLSSIQYSFLQLSLMQCYSASCTIQRLIFHNLTNFQEQNKQLIDRRRYPCAVAGLRGTFPTSYLPWGKTVLFKRTSGFLKYMELTVMIDFWRNLLLSN